MDIKVKQIGLWRTEVPRRPGALAAALEPLAQQGADLKVVRVRSAPGRARRNIVEVYAGEGRRAATVGREALACWELPLLVGLMGTIINVWP